MCGITGFALVNKDSHAFERLEASIASLAHRGPDGSGTYVRDGVHFGHTRLSIIDVRDVSNQPMLSDDGMLALVFNGEIYNYLELRLDLEHLGAKFRTRSDTEVLLHAYAIWGESCVERMNGMWSFAIHDRQRGIVFASRDRFGEKPFFYAIKGRAFYFASEAKAILAAGFKDAIDPTYFRTFLFANQYELPGITPFSRIIQLLPGHNLTYAVESGDISLQCYYHLGEHLSDLSSIDPNEAVERFGALMAESVRLRVRSDVPVGIALSGGIDSALIATAIRALADRREIVTPHAVTVDANENNEEISESAMARRIAEHCGLNWQTVTPCIDGMMDNIMRLHWHQEAPNSSMSVLMSWHLHSSLHKLGLKVVLDGQGGDELLLGYARYAPIALYERMASGNLIAAIGLAMKMQRTSDDLQLPRLAALAAWGWSSRLKELYNSRRTLLSPENRRLAPSARDIHIPMCNARDVQIDEIQRSTLPGLLRVADRNSMAHSVEVRVPFLDPAVVEFAVSLPTDIKFAQGYSKWPSRQLLGQRGLCDIGFARRKFGFQGADQQWIGKLTGAFYEHVERSTALEYLLGKRMPYVQYAALSYRDRWKLMSVAALEAQFGTF